MINYNKMDEVLNNLERQAEDLRSLSKEQEAFEKALGELSQLHKDIQTEREKVETIADAIKNIESAHASIDRNIETVLQDYKKLHSSFEYLELELRKNACLMGEVQDKLKNEIQEGVKNVNKRNNRIAIGVYIGVGFSIATFILAIVGLLI